MHHTLRLLILSFSIFIFHEQIIAQSLAVNTDGSAASISAIMDVKSIDKGVLIPRMTKAQKNTIITPATGLLIFQNAPDSIGFHYYDGSKWVWVTDSGSADSTVWKTTGNNSIKSSNFIGTLNDSALRFRIRNLPSGIVDSVFQNTALGYRALSSTTTGAANTAIGYQALASDTSGQVNTAIGVYALNANSRGQANTAVGSAALTSVTTGNNNTAVGQAALFFHLKNDGNTALGSNALQNDTTGFSNTAIGLFSMYLNSNGTYNTAVGRESLRSHLVNSNNTAVGSLALYNDVSGIENTVVGYNAFAVNATGTSNSALGAYTNLVAGNLTNATAIGYRAMAGQSNSLVLGSINGVNSSLADTKVGIGTTTPTAIIDVNGNFKIGKNGTVNNEVIKVSILKSIATVAAVSSNVETFTVTNAQIGSTVYVSPDSGLADGLIIAYARVSVAGTVEVKFTNVTGAPINTPAMNYQITVIR